MVESPFSNAAQGYSRLATSLADRAELFGADVSRVAETQQGMTATALMDLLNDNRRECEVLSQHATSMVSTCAVQTDVDHALIAAPSPADVDAAKDRYQAAIQMGSLEGMIANRERYNILRDERSAAYHAHESGTEGTRPKIVPPEEPPSTHRRGTGGGDGNGALTGEDGVQLMPLNRPAGSPFPAGGGGSGGMPVMPPMSAESLGTKLSGDTESAAPAGRGMATPPPMPPMQPQMGGAPAGGAPMGAMPGMPGVAMPKSKARDKDKTDGADFTMLSGDAAAGGAGALAATAANPDRGGTLHGVTTKADVSGKPVPVVGVRPGGAVPPMGGGGPMGGGPMGMGAMGGGAGLHGANSTSTKRPEIIAHDKKLLGDEAVENAVQDGLIGRKSANPPKPDDDKVG